MGLLKLLSFAGERVVDRVFEIGHLLEAAYGQLMLFEIVPDRFDARLLGTVPRQVDQMHVGRRQLGPRLGDSLARVDGVVVQCDHQGTPPLPVGRGCRWASRYLPQEGHQALRIDRADVVEGQPMGSRPLLRRRPRLPGPALGQHRPALKVQASRFWAVREVRAKDVHPPPLRCVEGHAEPCAWEKPTVGRRPRQGKAGFVQMAQIDQTAIPFFSHSSSTACRSATSPGSCLCLRVRLVRCHEIFARRRWTRTRSALKRTPWCSATQSASWAAVQVRVPLATSARTAASRAAVSADCLPPRGLLGRAGKPPSRKALIHARTVCSCWPRWRAMRGTLQPASERRTISSRSRVLGAIPAWRVCSRRSTKSPDPADNATSCANGNRCCARAPTGWRLTSCVPGRTHPAYRVGAIIMRHCTGQASATGWKPGSCPCAIHCRPSPCPCGCRSRTCRWICKTRWSWCTSAIGTTRGSTMPRMRPHHCARRTPPGPASVLPPGFGHGAAEPTPTEK